jgi:hypothetical protein
MRFLSSLSPLTILRQLRQRQESATFERLKSSQHVADLRLIFSVSFMIMVAGAVFALPFCFEREVIGNWKEIQSANSAWIWVRMAFAAIADSGPFIGAIVAIGGGVLAWTYQSGSARLGVIDLFACEIATLCRVAAVVDMVPHYIELFRATPADDIDGDKPSEDWRFTSQESYFPVFDSSVRDLQQLEAEVVDNVTAFYTYMKVMRDALRKLAQTSPPQHGGAGHDGWHRAVCNVVYMQFLALESARKAIEQLVEFEPTQAENKFTILLSEFVAYGFLRAQFKGDLRHRLLEAREPYYRYRVPEECQAASDQMGGRWERAQEVAREVMARHAALFATTTPFAAPEPAWTLTAAFTGGRAVAE